MADRRYESDGDRPADADRGREGFGDDQGTRIGRPDLGHPAPERAPLHGRGTGHIEGQPSTNIEAVPDGEEGSIFDDEASDASRQGPGQSRIQAAAESRSSDEREIYDL